MHPREEPSSTCLFYSVCTCLISRGESALKDLLEFMKHGGNGILCFDADLSVRYKTGLVLCSRHT